MLFFVCTALCCCVRVCTLPQDTHRHYPHVCSTSLEKVIGHVTEQWGQGRKTYTAIIVGTYPQGTYIGMCMFSAGEEK